MSRYDTVIVGAGISGLTAALVLAKNGKKVALVEQKEYLAPLLRRFKRAGAWCDPGFHYSGGLEQNGTLSVLFRYLGITQYIETIPLPPKSFDIISMNGQEYCLPYGYEELQNYLCLMFPKSCIAVKAYIKKLYEINDTTGFLNFDLKFDTFPYELYEHRSLKTFLEDAGAEPDLINLLGGHGLVLYGADAAETPLFVNASAMGSFYRAAYTIRGGADAILKGFEEQITHENIDLFLNHTVKNLQIGNNRQIQAVETGQGETLLCDTCISTIHPWLLAEILLAGKVRPAFISRLKNLENTFSPVLAFYKLDTIPEKIKESNYYLFYGNEPKLDIAFMAANQDAEFSGQKALAVLKSVPVELFDSKSREEYLQEKRRVIEKLTEQIISIFPELDRKITALDAATCKTFERYTRTPQGSIYGVKPTVKHRNLSPTTSVRGLYMAGQSVQSGVMGAMISAFMAAGNIIGMDELRTQVIQWV